LSVYGLKNKIKFINIKSSGVKKKITNKYAYFITPKIFLENFIIWSPSLLFAVLFNEEVAAYVAIAQRFGSTPATIFNQAVGVIFHRALVLSKEKYPKKIFSYVIITAVNLFGFYLIIVNLLGVQIRDAISYILGQGWDEVGVIFLIMMPLYLTQILAVLVDKIMIYTDMMGVKLYLYCIYCVILIVSIASSYYFKYNSYEAIELMSVSLSIAYVVSMFAVLFILFLKSKIKD
jgi:hypothetical protein